MLSFNVAIYLIGAATIVWSAIANKPYVAILIGLVWAGLILTLKMSKLAIPKMMIASAFVLVATVVTILTTPGRDGSASIIKSLISSEPKTTVSQNKENTEQPDPAGTILVNGKAGVLTGGGSWSNISDIERDNGFGEAYLGDKGATATYQVEAAAGGLYRIWVKLSDDAQHFDGARNATVTINQTQTIKYTHTSENTNGWKWYDLGSAMLQPGTNVVAFSKDDTTSAAYVMNQFKFVPSI